MTWATDSTVGAMSVGSIGAPAGCAHAACAPIEARKMTARTMANMSPARLLLPPTCALSSRHSVRTTWFASTRPVLSVGFLADLVLLELLVEIAARCADHFGGLRDVPRILTKLADQKCSLGVFLELAQGP